MKKQQKQVNRSNVIYKKNNEVKIHHKKIDSKIHYWFIGIIAISLFLYAQILSFDFVNLDDIELLVKDKKYFSDISNVWKGFTDSFLYDYYRPILFATFLMDYQLGSIDSVGNTTPFMYHFSNILFHTTACSLLLWFLFLLKYDKTIAFFTTLFFTVHPLFVQAVAWIAGRNDSLLAIFVLLSAIFFIRFVETKQKKHYFLFLLFLLGVLLTKEAGIGLIMVCFAYIFWIKKIDHRKERKLLLQILIGTALVIVIWYIFRKTAIRAAELRGAYRFPHIVYGWEAIKYNYPFLLESVFKFFVPFNISVFPMFSPIPTFLGIGVYILLLIITIFFKIEKKTGLWILLWWFVFLTPPIIFLTTDGRLSDYLEHRIYVPAIGCIIFLNEITQKWKEKVKNNSFLRIFRISALLIILLFGTLSFLHIQNFKNQYTYWESASKTSRHAGVWKILAKQAFEKNEIPLVKKYCLKSLELNPKDIEVCTNLAIISQNNQQYDSALLFYKKILEIDPKHWNTLYYAGLVEYEHKKNYTEAERYWKIAISLNTNETQDYENLIQLLLLQNRIEEAKEYALVLKKKGKDITQIFNQLSK